MPKPQYIFGQTKVHPAPLDPKVAPWSAPRGYTTSMAEEADALKAAARAGRAKVKVAGGAAAPLPPSSRGRCHIQRPQSQNIFLKVRDHFRNIFSELATNLRVNPHKFLAKLCCLTAELPDS